MEKTAIVNQTIYLDNNATTPLSDGVKRVVHQTLDAYYNPSSLYTNHNKPVIALIDTARKRVAALIGLDKTDAKHIVFNSGATEGNNSVFFYHLCNNPEKHKHIIVSSVEHLAVLETAKQYSRLHNISIDILPVDSKGKISEEMLVNAIKPETVLVSIMLANNELGNVYNIQRLADIVHSVSSTAKFHTDATQAIGKMSVDVKQLGVDYLTLSGHKIHAPKGVGALYVKDIESFTPFLFGGHQERGKRAGTENTIGIAALGQAAAEAAKLDDLEFQRIAALRDRMEKQIIDLFPGTVILGDTENRICNTSCFLLPDVEGYTICVGLDQKGICVSSGSACLGKTLGPSHVMNAIGVNRTPVRVSLSSSTTDAEIEHFISLLHEVYKKTWRK